MTYNNVTLFLLIIGKQEEESTLREVSSRYFWPSSQKRNGIIDYRQNLGQVPAFNTTTLRNFISPSQKSEVKRG
jgi:hypothetical protein